LALTNFKRDSRLSTNNKKGGYGKMSENNDQKSNVLSNVQGQMRLSERIAAFIPGFRGYKEKELRRESDKLIRNHLSLKLSTAKSTLREINQKLADRRYLDVLTDMDRLSARMDRIVEKVNHASYGYSGFFDAVKVKEGNLDHMIDFDNQLLDGVNGLSDEIDAFKVDLAAGNTSNLKTRVQNVSDKIESFEDTFDKREEVIMGVTQ
jgi:hypothetical protein